MQTLLNLFISSSVFAFTFVSGPNEAKLPVSSDNPQITFHWNGSWPSIKKKDEYQGGIYADLDDEDMMIQLLKDAFGLWNDVEGSYLDMEFEKDSDSVVSDSDKRFVVVVKKMDNLSAAAFAVPIMSDDGATIEDCDITVGDNSVEATRLAFVLAHEIGHCIGLGHNHTHRKALMGYTRGDENLWLSADDKAGAIYLYMDPALESAQKEFLGCASIGMNSKSAAFLLIFFPMLILLIRRRR